MGKGVSVFKKRKMSVPLSLIERRQRQFLVHSFLYYQLNESVISDEKYDSICKELVELQQKHPHTGKYFDKCRGLEDSGSGYYLRKYDYPEEIITTALRLLWEEDVPFHEFVESWGYKMKKTS